ncbi:MAG TPA: Sec-independent protein translocase TatB [Galbitalea sp.]|jgi:sec-independent protein translocase protein TatB
MFGLSFEKILLIGIVAAFLIGPQKLPHYAAVLARFVRQVRDFANGAKDRIKEEMGPEYDDVEWKSLDPRQYDPRRIIREALLEPSEAQAKTELLPNHDEQPMYRMDPVEFDEPTPVDAAAPVPVKAVKAVPREDKLAS